MYKFLIIPLIALLFSACKNEPKEVAIDENVDLSDYYFPVKAMKEVKVYEYEFFEEGSDDKGVFYLVFKPNSNATFFSKFYDENLQLKDSVLYSYDEKGVYVGFRYVLFENVWNRVMFDQSPYVHLNNRTKLDTTNTTLLSINQYGRRLENEMKIYFNGFESLETSYYDEDKVSKIMISSHLYTKQVSSEEKEYFDELTTVYNAKGIGTIKNVNVNKNGTTIFLLKRIISLDEFKALGDS